MTLAKFPIETENPKIDVTLPVGVHVLELTVKDSAGLVSAPDTVIIHVVQTAPSPPVIEGIEPAGGKQGEKLEAAIYGANLEDAKEVAFLLAGRPDESVTGEVMEGGAEKLLVVIQIEPDAAPGARSFTVTTPAGTAQSPAGVAFTVEGEVELPVIEGIEPAGGKQGEKLEAVIYGANLEGAKEVSFLLAGRPDESVTGEVMEGGPEKLLVVLQIEPDATPGARSFTVTTPAGTAQSPAGVAFTVEGEVELPVIEGIEPAGGKQGEKLEAAIYGVNLEDAKEVAFLLAGRPDESVTGEVMEGGPEKLLVVIQIEPDAAPGARSFTVTTPAGTAQSPAGVTFTVEGEVVAGPTIKAIEPTSGRQGEELEAAIFGENLEKATAVEFILAGLTPREVLSGVVAEVKEATADRVVVGVRIAATAEPGAYNFRVTTPVDIAQSPADVAFTVLEAGVRPPEEPVIEGIVPTSGQVGGKVEAVIGGVNLGDPKNVTFFIERLTPVSRTGITPGELPEPDKNIQTEIVRLGSTDTALRVVITISESAELGLRGYAVETAGGIALGPKPFTVEAGGLVPIRTIEEVSGIGPASTTRLADVGITDLGKLAAAEPAYVAETLGVSEERATEFVKEAKRLLGVPGVELSERSVEEVSGIGPASAASLAEFGITDLAEMAAMEPARLAKMLEVSEDRAAGFVKGAQELLTR